jgi:hypothetical protein
LGVRQDTSGDKFRIELDGQESNNRGIAGELIMRRAEKLKARFGDDIRIGRFAGFDLFPASGFNNTTEMVCAAKTVTARGSRTRRSAPSARWKRRFRDLRNALHELRGGMRRGFSRSSGKILL